MNKIVILCRIILTICIIYTYIAHERINIQELASCKYSRIIHNATMQFANKNINIAEILRRHGYNPDGTPNIYFAMNELNKVLNKDYFISIMLIVVSNILYINFNKTFINFLRVYSAPIVVLLIPVYWSRYDNYLEKTKNIPICVTINSRLYRIDKKYMIEFYILIALCDLLLNTILGNKYDSTCEKNIIDNITQYLSCLIRKTTMKKDFTCIICIDDCDDVIIELECKHKFHYKCIKKYSAYSNNCPLCRNNFSL